MTFPEVVKPICNLCLFPFASFTTVLTSHTGENRFVTAISGIYGVDFAIAEGVSLVLDTEVFVSETGTGGYNLTTILGNPSVGISITLP